MEMLAIMSTSLTRVIRYAVNASMQHIDFVTLQCRHFASFMIIFWAVAIFTTLLYQDVLALTLCPGEVVYRSIKVSHRFTCKRQTLQCIVLLNTSHSLNFYEAQKMCERINGTVLELRNEETSHCFENVKKTIAPKSPFWINIVEVETPRCEGICPNFIDLRWASGLPPDICRLRSRFVRSCIRHVDLNFSCSQKGCCEVSIDHYSPACLLPTSHAAGKLKFHKLAAEENFAKIPGRRCVFIDASDCPNGGNGNVWHLKLCDGVSPQHKGCRPSQNIRVACIFPKRPIAPSEILVKSKSGKQPCLKPGKHHSDAIFWIAMGAIISASVIILFQLIFWCRLRRQAISNTQDFRRFPRRTESFVSPTLDATNLTFHEESCRSAEIPESYSRIRLYAQDS